MFELVNIINVLTFLGLSMSAYVIFYLTKDLDPDKQVTTNVFMLAIGLNMIGLSHLFRVWSETALPSFIVVTLFLGTTLTFGGIVTTFYEKKIHARALGRKSKEIREVMSYLKEKYYKQELSAEELKSLYSELLKELAETEVKMKNKEEG
jgi:hypothetical protein